MSQVVLEIPNESLLALKVTATEASELLRLAAAVKLFGWCTASGFSNPVGRLWGGYLSFDRRRTSARDAPCLN